MTLRHAISIPATLAGVWFMTTISPSCGQAVHGQIIAASAPSLPAHPAANSAAAGDGAVLKADFDTLASFTFDAPDAAITNRAAQEKVASQIPDAIRKLDGKVVRIRGFMMPVKESAGKTTEFLITRSRPSCCFSGATGLNEFVTVESSGKGVAEDMDDPVAIEGKPRVGLITQSGFVVGLYQMDDGKMIESGH